MPCKNHPFVEDSLVRCAVCGEAFCPDCIVEIGGLPYCFTCKTELISNLRSGVPAGELDLATIGRRFWALWIDGVVITLPLIAVIVAVLVPLGVLESTPASPMSMMPWVLMFSNLFVSIGVMAAYVLYEALMLGAGGQTIGKKAMSLKVVTAEGGDISRGQAWARAVTRQVFGIVPCLGLLDYLVAFGQERTCVHDILAKTRVVNWP